MLAKLKKNGTAVYQNVDGLTVSVEYVKVIVDRGWLCGAISPTTIVTFLALLGLNIYVFGSDLFELCRSLRLIWEI